MSLPSSPANSIRWEPSKEINIPIDLFIWVTRNEVIKLSVLKTFICLKLTWPDRFLLTTEVYTALVVQLRITNKTAKQHIAALRKAGFLGYAVTTNRVFLRSKYELVPKSRRFSFYQVRVSLKELENFNEFTFAAIVAYLIKRRRNLARYHPALLNESAFQGCDRAFLSRTVGFPFSVSYLGEFLRKSKSWADKRKQEAIKLRLIKVHHRLYPTGVLWKERSRYLNIQAQRTGIKKWKGEIYRVGTDITISHVQLIRWKKSGRMRNESTAGQERYT